jgi:UDPglucose 6-dehydrogenase
VGLVSGTCFAEMGNFVTCVDIDSAKIERLRSGELPIFEPGLERYFERNTAEERLQFTTDIAAAVPDSDIVFLALPTPSDADGAADLSAVRTVAGRLGALIEPYTVVVNKSTVPVGTADQVREIIAADGLQPGEDFDVVSNPEFLREGVAVDDFMKPERVVIGTSSERAGQIMRDLYEPFVRSGNPILVMDEPSAEMTKYAANAMLATRISFMNEIANVCERVGANVEKIRHGIGTDSRIGPQFLYAGIGFGGSCFPKDVKALHHTAAEHDYDFKLLEAVARINDYQREVLAHRLIDYFDGDVEGKRIAIWGLAFKANTDDVREAPSHIIIETLLEAGAEIVAYDPEAMTTTRETLGAAITYAEDEYSVLEDAQAVMICTEWHEFRRPEFERMKELLARPVIFDGRNLFEREKMAGLGFDYYSIGRPHLPPVEDRSDDRVHEREISANGSSSP